MNEWDEMQGKYFQRGKLILAKRKDPCRFELCGATLAGPPDYSRDSKRDLGNPQFMRTREERYLLERVRLSKLSILKALSQFQSTCRNVNETSQLLPI